MRFIGKVQCLEFASSKCSGRFCGDDRKCPGSTEGRPAESRQRSIEKLKREINFPGINVLSDFWGLLVFMRNRLRWFLRISSLATSAELLSIDRRDFWSSQTFPLNLAQSVFEPNAQHQTVLKMPPQQFLGALLCFLNHYHLNIDSLTVRTMLRSSSFHKTS